MNSASENGAGVYQKAGTLTLSGGLYESSTARYGGVVYADGGTTTISYAIMRNNTVTENGAGIYNGAGGLAVEGSVFTGNRARYGAAISSHAAMTATKSTFSDNVAQENGGGIYSTVNGSSVGQSCFSGNTARNGGAISSTANGNFNAKNNWWGSASGPTSAMTNGKLQTSPHLSSCPN